MRKNFAFNFVKKKFRISHFWYVPFYAFAFLVRTRYAPVMPVGLGCRRAGAVHTTHSAVRLAIEMDCEPHKNRFLDCVRTLQSSGSSPQAIAEANRYLTRFKAVDRYWRICMSVLLDNSAAARRRSETSMVSGGNIDLNFSKYAEFISIKLLSNAIINDNMLSACDTSEASDLTDLIMEILYSTAGEDFDDNLSCNHTLSVNTKQLCLCLASIITWSVHDKTYSKYATESILPRILNVASSALSPVLVSLYIFEELPLQLSKRAARRSSSSSRLTDPDAFLASIMGAKEYIWSAFISACTYALAQCAAYGPSQNHSALLANLLVMRACLSCLVEWGANSLPTGGSREGSAMQSWSTASDIVLTESRARCLLLTIQRLGEIVIVAGSPGGADHDSALLLLMSEVASSAMDLLTGVLSSRKTPLTAATAASSDGGTSNAFTDLVLQAFIVMLRLCDALAGGLATLRSQLCLRIDSLLQLRKALSDRAGPLSDFSGEGDSSLTLSLATLLASLAQNHSQALLADAYADARSRYRELFAETGAALDCELLLTSSLLLCLCLPSLPAAAQVVEVYSYLTDMISSPASMSALVEPTLAAVLLQSMYPPSVSQLEVRAHQLSQSLGRSAGREAEIDGLALDALQGLQEYRREGCHLLQRVCVAWDRDGSAAALLFEDCAAVFAQAGALRGYGECVDSSARRQLLCLAHAAEAYLFVVASILETQDGGGESEEEEEGSVEARGVPSPPCSGPAACGRWLALLAHISLSLEPCQEALSQHFPAVLSSFLSLWSSAPLLVRRALSGGAAAEQPRHAVERLLSSTLLIAVNTLQCPYSNNRAAKAISCIARQLRRHLHFCAVGVCQRFMSALPSIPAQALRQSDVRDVYCSLGTLILSISHKETMLLIASQVFTSTSERLGHDCVGVRANWADVAGDSVSRLDGLLKGLGGYARGHSNVLRDSIPAVTLSLLQLLEQQVAFYRGSPDEETVKATAAFASLVLRTVARLVDTFSLSPEQLEEALAHVGRVIDCCSDEALSGVPASLAAAVRNLSELPPAPVLADKACAIICKCLQRAVLSLSSSSSGGGAGLDIGCVVDASDALAELPCECLRLVRQCCLAAPQVLLLRAGGITSGYFELLVAVMAAPSSRGSAAFMRAASTSLSSVQELASLSSGAADPSVATLACAHMQASHFALLRLLLLDGVFSGDMRVARVYAELMEHALLLLQSSGGGATAASVLQAVCEELVPLVTQRAPSLTHRGRDGVAVTLPAPSFVRMVCGSLQRQVGPSRGGIKRAFMALAFAAQGGDYSSQRNNNTFDYDLICV